jgi:hypothetical protein
VDGATVGEVSVVEATSAVAVTLVEFVATLVEVEVAEEMHEVERLTEEVVTAADEAATNRLIEDDLRTSSKITAT